MSIINKSKTVMIKPIFNLNEPELLIKFRHINKENIEQEKSYYQYEKLKHNLKKRLRENLMDELATKIAENESKKDIYTFTSLNLKCDSKGLYHRLKKIKQNNKLPPNIKPYFFYWFYTTPNAVKKHKINKNRKNDRNRIIRVNYYQYQNTRFSNIARKTIDMTTKKKKANIQIKIPVDYSKTEHKPKYKYNYSSNNSNISYNKFEFGRDDPNKGNIYIGKKNGDASYYQQKKYNNFGSLTVIQHNVENNKKCVNYKAELNSWWKNNLPKYSRNKKYNNKYDSENIIHKSESSWTIFCNSVNGRKAGESVN